MKTKWVKHHLKNICSEFMRDERGQSTTEYILILSVVVMIAMKFKKVITDQVLTKLMGQVSGDIDKFNEN